MGYSSLNHAVSLFGIRQVFQLLQMTSLFNHRATVAWGVEFSMLMLI